MASANVRVRREGEGVEWSSVTGGCKRFQAQLGRADDVVV